MKKLGCEDSPLLLERGNWLVHAFLGTRLLPLVDIFGLVSLGKGPIQGSFQSWLQLVETWKFCSTRNPDDILKQVFLWLRIWGGGGGCRKAVLKPFHSFCLHVNSFETQQKAVPAHGVPSHCPKPRDFLGFLQWPRESLGYPWLWETLQIAPSLPRELELQSRKL